MNYNEMIKRLAEKGYSIVDPLSFYEKIDEPGFASLVSDIDAYAAEMDERSKTQKLEDQLTSNYRRIIDILGQTPEYINGTPEQKEAVDSALRSIYGKYISFASADDKRAELDSIESELARTRTEIIRIRDDSTISAEEKGARYPALFSQITSLTNAKKEKEAELQAEYADLRERQSIGPRVVMESPFPGGDGKYTTPDGVEHTYGNIEVTYPDFFEEFDALFYAIRALNIPNDQEIMTCRDRMLQAARRIKDHDVVRRRVTSEDLEEKLVNYGIVRNVEAARDAIMPNTPVETPVSAPEPEVAPVEPPAPAPEPEVAPVEPPAPAPEPEVAPVEPPALAPEPEVAPIEPPAPAPEPEPEPEDDFIVGNMVELNEEARSALKSDEIPEELQIGLYPGVEYKIVAVRRNPFGTRKIGLEIESLWGKQVRFVSEHYLSPSKTHISGYDPLDLVKISAEGIAELAAIGKIPKGITLKPTELYVVMGIDAKTGKVQILVDDIDEVEISVDRKYLTLATKKKNEPIPEPEVAPVEPPVSAPAAPNPTSDIVIGSIVAPDIGAIMAGYPEVEELSLIKDYEVVEIKDGSPRTIGIKEIENGKTVGPVRYVTEEKLLSKHKKAPEKKSTPISSEDFEVGGFAKVISEIAVTECKKRYEIDIEKGKEYKIVELRPDWVVLDINGEHIPVRRSYAIKTRKKAPEPIKPEKPITAAASGIAVGDYVRLSEYGIKNCKDLSSTSGPGYKLDVFDEYKVLGIRTAVEGKQHFITIALGDQKVEFDSKVFELYRKSHEAKAVVESGDFVKLNNRREPKPTESDDAFDKIFELFNKDPYKELDPSKEYEVVRVTDGGKSYEIKVGDKIESYEAKYFDLSKKKKVVKAEGARKDTGAASAPETPVSAPAPETPVEPPKPVRRLVTSVEEKKLTDRMCTVYLALGIIGTLSALVLSGGGLFVLAAVGTTIITALRKSYAVSGILNPIDRKLISKFRKLAKTAKEKAKERFADEMTSGEEDALDDIDKAADEMDTIGKPAEKAKDPSARTI